MFSANDTRPIMFELKESTQNLHDQTEHGNFNKELVNGRLPLTQFVESLAQFYLIHRALETQLRSHLPHSPAMAAVVLEYQFQEPYLLNDLAYFGRNCETIQPLPATNEFIARIDAAAAECPAALLGMHYVFEGSNNGSKFIARAIRRAYNLTDGNGTQYLDPYGDQQRDYWQAFKDAMNAQDFADAERHAIVRAASETFAAVMRLHRELDAGSTPAPQTAVPKAGGCPFHR